MSTYVFSARGANICTKSFSGETPWPTPYIILRYLYVYIIILFYTNVHNNIMLTGTTRPFLFRCIFIFSPYYHPSPVLCVWSKFNFIKCTPEVDRDDSVNIIIYAMGTVNTNQPYTQYYTNIHCPRSYCCWCTWPPLRSDIPQYI